MHVRLSPTASALGNGVSDQSGTKRLDRKVKKKKEKIINDPQTMRSSSASQN